MFARIFLTEDEVLLG